MSFFADRTRRETGEHGWAARAGAVRRRIRLIDVVLMALILLAGTSYYFSGIDSTEFHQDESRWLNRAHYLGDLRDPFGPTWYHQYLTMGQPPVGSYAMGLALLIQGRDLDTNGAWDFRRSPEWNVQHGNMPDADDMQAGRRFNSVLGALSAAFIYLVVRNLSNPIGGVAAAIFLLANPLQTWHNRLALADTTLTFTLALLFLVTYALMQRPRWWLALAAGMLIGLGGANKFTPLALAVPLAGIGALMLLKGWRDRRSLRGDRPWGPFGFPPLTDAGWMLVSLPFTAVATFVAVYPYLWPNPITRTRYMIQFRQDEMASQYRSHPQFQVDNVWQGLEKTWTGLTGRWSSARFFMYDWGFDGIADHVGWIDVVIALIGIALLVWVGARKGLRSAELAIAALIVFQTVTIIVNMRVDFERYYLPIVLGEVTALGVAIGYATNRLIRPWPLRSLIPWRAMTR